MNTMRAFLILFLIAAASSFSYSQKLRFKISNHKDTTVNLVRYLGKGLYYSDTAEMKNGVVEFDGSKQKAGILGLFMPDQKMLEFIYNDEEVSIEATYPDMMGTSKVKKSEENMIFHEYVRFMNTQRLKAENFNNQRKAYKPEDEEYKRLTKLMEEATEAVELKQQSIVAENPGKLVAKIVKMATDIKIPESPKDENGKVLDSTFKFNYYRKHYFDNFDFNDDRLVRTPIFHGKLAGYFGKDMMFPHCDSVIRYAFDLCDRLPEGSETYQYTVSWITSHYEKSKIMNMDKVFVWMAERYYCAKDSEGKPKGFWVPKESLDKICEKANTNRHLVFGVRPPNVVLRDTTDTQWRDYYSLKSEYTILYFWDPECGHCKKVTPKLETLYSKKLKDRNVEVFAVGKAIGDDFEKWKAFIRKNHLSFINVAVTDRLYKDAMDKSDNQAKLQELLRYTTIESLNYQQTFDIFTTPRVFVLDKDKKIIGKGLTISQLEDLLDRLQGQKDAEKLFPPETEDPEEREAQEH